MKSSQNILLKMTMTSDDGYKVESYTPTLHNDVEYKKSISNIPRRYLNAQLKAKTEEQKKLINKMMINYANKKLEDISDMLINGTIGTGKTHIALAFINKLLEANTYCKYATEYDLLNLFFMKKYDKFNQFKQTDVLIIDELGKRDLLDWQTIQIEELLSYRYNEQLPTILITNRNKKEFKAFVGDRVVDRLKDNNAITVTLTGASLRGSSE